MIFTDKFSLTSDAPMQGANGAIIMKLKFQEVADAETAGTGVGVPDENGTPVRGTTKSGTLCYLNSNGNLDKAVQTNLSSEFAKLYLVCFAGLNDWSGAYVGVVSALCGARFETVVFDAGVYTKGMPLVPSSVTPGNFMQKASATDNIQGVGYVGPKGTFDGLLDVVMPQGSGI